MQVLIFLCEPFLTTLTGQPARFGESIKLSEGLSIKARMMSGNQACAEGAVAAGCRFFAGYPITPSSEIAEYLCTMLPARGGKFIQMEDEIAAMGAIIGASLTGVKAMTATSGPGFSLKQENIGYASMAEVPCVIVNVMRGGPSTGMPTLPAQMDVQQARWGSHGDRGVIALTACSAQETFEQTIRAFNLSEKYMMPVILLLDEIVGHSTEKVNLPTLDEIEIISRKAPEEAPGEYYPYRCGEDDIPVLANFGKGYHYHVTGLCHDETGFPTNESKEIDSLIRRLSRKVTRNVNDIVNIKEYMLDDADFIIFAYGSVSRSAKSAVDKCRKEGLKVGLFEPTVIWPFPSQQLLKALGKASGILVPELNLGQMAREVELAVKCSVPVHRLGRVDGNPIIPDQIVQKIREVV